MVKILLLTSIIVLLAVTAGQEMYKVRELTKTLEELERIRKTVVDRKGKEIIHNELGDFVSSQEDNSDVRYDATAINELYTRSE